MSTPKIRACDKGTAYAAALVSGARAGISRATDAEVMAAFCEHDLQILAGAVSPRLTWEGAQARGMTTLELMRIAAKSNLDALDELQFGEAPPVIRVIAPGRQP
jgi:hypothetical protein